MSASDPLFLPLEIEWAHLTRTRAEARLEELQNARDRAALHPNDPHARELVLFRKAVADRAVHVAHEQRERVRRIRMLDEIDGRVPARAPLAVTTAPPPPTVNDDTQTTETARGDEHAA